MNLIINGNKTDVNDRISVAGLLNELKIEPDRVAVEVNLKIIKKADYEGHELQDGDAVEIVNFVGGG